MTAPYCAVCGQNVPMDMDHVEIDAEWVHTDDRNDIDNFLLHMECALRTIGSWEAPA